MESLGSNGHRYTAGAAHVKGLVFHAVSIADLCEGARLSDLVESRADHRITLLNAAPEIVTMVSGNRERTPTHAEQRVSRRYGLPQAS